MRLNLVSASTPICVDKVAPVDGKRAVRIDGDEEEARVGLWRSVVGTYRERRVTHINQI